MKIGVKNERGAVRYVDGTYISAYHEWKNLHDEGHFRPNVEAYYIPHLEYALQVLNFWLETTIFSVIERLGRLSIFPAALVFIYEFGT